MALPKLNVTPKYELTIPSMQKTVKFRPYLVKEEKVLMMASESKETKAILTAIVDTIKDCVEPEVPVDYSKLTTFDIEYMFTKIRSKSVGEVSRVVIKCQNEECKHNQEVEIDLDNVDVPVKGGSNIIRLSDDIQVEMNWPSYKVMIENDFDKMKEDPTSIFQLIGDSIEAILTEEERILVKDQPKEDVQEFINSMTSQQFESIASFFNEMPQMQKLVEFKCIKCGTESSINLKGMSDFF